MATNILINVVLVSMISVCLYTDIRERKIYNKITLPVIIIALVLNTYNMGLTGIIFTGKGMLLAFGMMLIPFIKGGIGGGDVKLLMAIGALKGAYFVFHTTLATFLIGGLIALVIIILRHPKKSFPYGIAIFFGTLVSYLVVRV